MNQELDGGSIPPSSTYFQEDFLTELDRLKELEAKATPGSWNTDKNDIDRHRYLVRIRTANRGILFRTTNYGKMIEDAELVVAFRNLLPKLIAVVEAAKLILPHIPDGDLLGAGKYSEHNQFARNLRDALAALEQDAEQI